ncbi:MAG: hypothetical protein ACFB21_06155 [Opitutales bacterium]
MNKCIHQTTTAAVSALAVFLAGCGDNAASKGTASDVSPETSESPVSMYLLESEPEGAVNVEAARASAEPGELIVVSGQIGATMNPFGENFATLVLADESIMFCNEMGDDDHCATPWDACCEDPEKVTKGRASVQLVDAEGLPLQGSLRGVGGLQELDHVVVTGTVDTISTPENLVVNASGIYRKSE